MLDCAMYTGSGEWELMLDAMDIGCDVKRAALLLVHEEQCYTGQGFERYAIDR